MRAKPAVGEGPLHQGHHADDDDGARPPRRPVAHARHRRGARGGRARLRRRLLPSDVSTTPVAEDSRQPRTSGRSPAEVASRETHGRRLCRARLRAGSIVSRGGGQMQKADKERVVEELTERLRSADTLIVADYRGLTNSQLASLRVELLKHGAKLHRREEHAHPAGGRGSGRGRVARAARGADRDRVRRGGGRPGRRGQGAQRRGQGHEDPRVAGRRARGQPDHRRGDRAAREAAAARRAAGAARRGDRRAADASSLRC